MVVAVLVAWFPIAGCVTPTPPGKLTQRDFVSKTATFSVPIDRVLGNFYEGFRYCGAESGGLIFVTHHGISECSPPRANGSVTCDLYMGSLEGRPGFVLGRADFVPTGGRTQVEFQVRTYAAGKDKILSAWERFAAGQARQVCP